MLRRTSRFVSALAALSMMALPVVAEAHGGRGGWGGRGWGGRHHDRGIDGGDVLAGILILGGIAAIASAASKPKAGHDERYDYPPEDTRNSENRDYAENRPYDGGVVDDRAPTGSYGQASRDPSRALDDAVDSCVNSAVRRGDVEQIFDVQRSGDGYRVSGDLSGGRRFSCMVDADGRVDIDVTGARDAGPRSGF